MITIKGKQFSEETIVEALMKHCNFEEEKEKYIFQAGDIAKFGIHLRIIVWVNGNLVACDGGGYCVARGQAEFESCGYKKIGILTDFIKN